MAEDELYCVAWGRDRREVEAYLYGGNIIVAEYRRPRDAGYMAIVACQDSSGFGARSQAARFASGTCGAQDPRTRRMAEQDIEDLHGAHLIVNTPQPTGKRSRPSPLSA
jgi:hypothetical protein